MINMIVSRASHYLWHFDQFRKSDQLKEREVKKLEQYQMGSDENDSFSQTKNIQNEKENAKRLSIGSAFRCFSMNHQVHSVAAWCQSGHGQH